MENNSRRSFVRGLLTGGAAALVAPSLVTAHASPAHASEPLHVWSCGGLAEAMKPAHDAYTAKSGVPIAYTGAFAGALGKSLLDGKGETEIFAGRVLALAKKLRAAGKMLFFRPLCFTSYVLVTPRGNPASITSVADLARPGVRVAMAPKASPPGSQSVFGILAKAHLTEAVMLSLIHI